jgi:hypothetical protein
MAKRWNRIQMPIALARKAQNVQRWGVVVWTPLSAYSKTYCVTAVSITWLDQCIPRISHLAIFFMNHKSDPASNSVRNHHTAGLLIRSHPKKHKRVNK